MTHINYRMGTREDISALMHLIRGLAVYEKFEDALVTKAEDLEEWLFDKQWGQVMVAETDEKVIGMMLYYRTLPAYVGRGGYFIDTIYIEPEYRGLGIGKAFFCKLAHLAKESGCGRLEWICLDDNIGSVEFYEHIGGEHLDGCGIFRMGPDGIEELASKSVLDTSIFWQSKS